MDPLKVNKQVNLTELQKSDISTFVKYLNNKNIYDKTCRIPHPYTAQDGDYWIHHVSEWSQKIGTPTQFAIRHRNGALLGCIGFLEEMIPGNSHKGEIGYWVAEPYWGQGIMTDAVRVICELGFSKFGLVRIFATVFVWNDASSRVLEKNDFEYEGLLKKV